MGEGSDIRGIEPFEFGGLSRLFGVSKNFAGCCFSNAEISFFLLVGQLGTTISQQAPALVVSILLPKTKSILLLIHSKACQQELPEADYSRNARLGDGTTRTGFMPGLYPRVMALRTLWVGQLEFQERKVQIGKVVSIRLPWTLARIILPSLRNVRSIFPPSMCFLVVDNQQNNDQTVDQCFSIYLSLSLSFFLS